MQHGDGDRQLRGRALCVQGFQHPEGDGHIPDGIVEGILSHRQVEISAQADAVHTLPRQGPADMEPVGHGIPFRMAALREGGQAAQPHGEQVGMEPELMHRDVCTGAQAAFKAGEYAFDQAVKTDGGKEFSVGFHADPAVVIENIGFLAPLVDDLHQGFRFFRHKALDEVHIVPFAGRRGTVGCLQFTLVDKILGRQGIAGFLLKGFQGGGTDREIIAGPVHKAGAAPEIAAEDPDKVVEKRGQTHHVRLRVCFAPLFQPVFQIFPGQGMAGIQLAEMLGGPVVGGVVVHIDLFPDPPDEERGSVAVIRNAAGDGNDAVFVPPGIGREQAVFRPVPDLPEGNGFRAVVQLKLFLKIAFQRADLQRAGGGCDRIGGEETLLLGIGMLAGEFIMLPDDTEGGIDSVSGGSDFRRKLRAVAVPDHICAPFFGHLQRQLFITRFSGQGEAAFCEQIHGLIPAFCSRFRHFWAKERRGRSLWAQAPPCFRWFFRGDYLRSTSSAVWFSSLVELPSL